MGLCWQGNVSAFYMLSRLVTAFLLRRKCLSILWLHLSSAVILEPKKMKSVTVSPSICHEVWWWRRFLRVPWTARRSNQSILKEISPEYSLEGLMLKLKLQYFGHLMQRTDSLEKILVLGRLKAGVEGDNRGWDSWMASLTLYIS